MRKSRVNRYKKSKNPMIIGIVSGVLVVAIVAVLVYVYKDQLFQSEAAVVDTPEQKQTEQPIEEPVKETVEEPKPAIEVDAGGYAVSNQEVIKPTYIDGILIASKKYPLPATYNQGEDPEAKAALNQMMDAAKKGGYSLVAFSGFRSYEYQTTLYTNYVNRDGQAEADRYSARPGYSEHQTGLAFDIGEKGNEDVWLTAEFGETEAGKWLVEHAHDYGFILRYPQGKEDITGFMYESWHFRYLGIETATKVKEAGVTLEEYLGIE